MFFISLADNQNMQSITIYTLEPDIKNKNSFNGFIQLNYKLSV